MPQFAYKAKDELGKTVKGILASENEGTLEVTLNNEGLYLISLAEFQEKKVSVKRKLNRRDLIAFTIHLATVLSAGASLAQGLQDLAMQAEDPSFRRLIEDIHKSIEGGSSLSSALERHPTIFSEIYIRIVKAGEVTGNLDAVLFDLVKFLEWQEELASNVKQASYYPAILVTAITILIFVLFTFVFPKFKGILLSMNVPLPLPTRIVMSISNFLVSTWYFIIFGLAGGIIGQRFYIKTPKGRYFFDKMKLKLPIFGGLIRKTCLSRFAHYFAMLFRSGVEISQSLEVVERLVGNAVFAEVIKECTKNVRSGKSISTALRESGEFPSMVIRMIAIGESTGELEVTLDKICNFYNQEISATIKKIFAIMEPLIIMFIALVVLTVAVAIYLPMYKAMGSIGVTPR